MTPALLSLCTANPVVPARPGASQAADPATSGDIFGALLSGKLGAATPTAAAKAPAPARPAAGSALESSIAKMVAAGKSDSEIAAILGAQLAASTAQVLGATDADARAQLAAVFSQALAPPGEGGALQSAAERTKALTQRFLKVQTLVESLVNGQASGQQNRISGTFSDAKPAKEAPAPLTSRSESGSPPATRGRLMAADSGAPPSVASTSSTLADAASAVASPGSAMPAGETTAALASGDPATLAAIDPREPEDGRSVNLGDLSAVAAGGSTVLGRVLTRAAIAADARQTTAGTSDTSADAATAGSGEPPVAAFIKSFTAALGASVALPQLGAHASSAAEPAALPPTGHDAAATTTFVPAVAPFSVERSLTPPAAAAPAAAPSEIDQSAIVDQVLRGAFLRTTGTSSEMRLSLVPETLGDVNVQLVVTAGSVAAHVVAQTPEVRDALVAAQPQLTKSLADAGLKLASFTVDLSGNGFAGFSGHAGGGGQPGRRGSRAIAALDGDETDESALDAIPSFAPPAFGAGGGGDYNYLA